MDGPAGLRALLASAGAPARAEAPPPSEAAVAETIAYLASREASVAIAADPYWPKWDSPWWRMTLLWELGRAGRIPREIVGEMAAALRAKYLPVFPLRAEEVPAGVDTYRDVACHCALGTIAQVLTACGVNVDPALPWLRPWFLRYQLPDGGWNCDEAAYTRPVPRSSVVSTLPVLEAALGGLSRPLTPEEEALLDRGAAYLIRRRLCRSVSRGDRLMDEAWLLPCFPRFYHYDVLRGLTFLVTWAERRRRPLPAEAVAEAVTVLGAQLDSGGILHVGRRGYAAERTLRRGADGAWTPGHPAGTFPLLDEVSRVGRPSPELTAAWRAALAGLRRLADAGALV
ncbi:MAG: hypothetical protein L0216_07150 [Planctomycetales bacterium]|nr:hypothetical protein [Planctomycetales bacterium]